MNERTAIPKRWSPHKLPPPIPLCGSGTPAAERKRKLGHMNPRRVAAEKRRPDILTKAKPPHPNPSHSNLAAYLINFKQPTHFYHILIIHMRHRVSKGPNRVTSEQQLAAYLCNSAPRKEGKKK